ncbi:hypothetical protein BU24DRAFT_425789 [Aaosphaeria arxii CBS 175.79]|uniref:Uncharacterized protein n=1 Tax=Aaosphaeria arxii CBS 175.79 TaxID=1450172 RepID=A0A6A5XI19_9PLEO|nr:uncharacterized protein BU24DRAFT_425789 [Aaosphaeria arxii CBS 175.79]KAF2011964.1 hypothetical protein BU24DRAFT_425789 [Aaosphaeria arxii CBS 175.79]
MSPHDRYLGCRSPRYLRCRDAFSSDHILALYTHTLAIINIIEDVFSRLEIIKRASSSQIFEDVVDGFSNNLGNRPIASIIHTSLKSKQIPALNTDRNSLYSQTTVPSILQPQWATLLASQSIIDTMTRPKARTISRPFDARHVGGIDVLGTSSALQNATPIIQPPQRSLTSMTIEPDEVPTHMNMAARVPPKRSNSIASGFNRPSLRLKTSLSILRNRATSNSPDRAGKRKEDSSAQETARSADVQRRQAPTFTLPPPPPPPPPASTSSQQLRLRTPPQTQVPNRTPLPRPLPQSQTQLQSQPPTVPPKVPKKPSAPPPTTRPKRADSGTAISIDDVPVETRPLGFKEIVSVPSFQERMKLYERTREYWASADHGLGEWVGRAGSGVVGGRREVRVVV